MFIFLGLLYNHNYYYWFELAFSNCLNDQSWPEVSRYALKCFRETLCPFFLYRSVLFVHPVLYQDMGGLKSITIINHEKTFNLLGNVLCEEEGY